LKNDLIHGFFGDRFILQLNVSKETAAVDDHEQLAAAVIQKTEATTLRRQRNICKFFVNIFTPAGHLGFAGCQR